MPDANKDFDPSSQYLPTEPTNRQIFSRKFWGFVFKKINSLLRLKVIDSKDGDGNIIVGDNDSIIPYKSGTGAGSGDLNYRGLYDAAQNYNVDDVVYTSPTASTRVPWVCERVNGPSSSVHAPSFPPDPGTVYWRCIAFFFSNGYGRYWTETTGEVMSLWIHPSSRNIYIMGNNFPFAEVEDRFNSAVTLVRRSGFMVCDNKLSILIYDWYLESSQSFSLFLTGFAAIGANQLFLAGTVAYVNRFQVGDPVAGLGGVALLNDDGSVDTSFNPVTSSDGAQILAIVIGFSGQLFVSIGSVTPTWKTVACGYLIEVDSSGNQVGAFNTTGKIGTAIGLGHGTIYFGGFIYYVGLDSTLSYPDVFKIDSGANVVWGGSGALYAGGNGPFALVPNGGDIMVCGEFTSFNSATHHCIIKINTAGALVGGFTSPTLTNGGGTPAIWSCAVDGSGRIIIVGDFDSVNGVARFNCARLNANGTLDTTFIADTGARAWDAVVNDVGEVIICGQFTTVNGQAAGYIARLDSMGNLIPP